MGVADREILLPSGIRRIESGKPLHDLQGLYEGFQRPLRIAPHSEQTACPLVADREIPLPSGVRRIETGTNFTSSEQVVVERFGIRRSNQRIEHHAYFVSEREGDFIQGPGPLPEPLDEPVRRPVGAFEVALPFLDADQMGQRKPGAMRSVALHALDCYFQCLGTVGPAQTVKGFGLIDQPVEQVVEDLVELPVARPFAQLGSGQAARAIFLRRLDEQPLGKRRNVVTRVIEDIPHIAVCRLAFFKSAARRLPEMRLGQPVDKVHHEPWPNHTGQRDRSTNGFRHVAKTLEHDFVDWQVRKLQHLFPARSREVAAGRSVDEPGGLALHARGNLLELARIAAALLDNLLDRPLAKAREEVRQRGRQILDGAPEVDFHTMSGLQRSSLLVC